MVEDKVSPLWELGVQISNSQQSAVMKGLSVQINNRYQSMADLYYDIYQERLC